MKKRFILASSLAIVLSVGAFLGLAFNQRAGQLRAARVDAATATTQNLFQQDTQGAHLPGNAVYFIPESSVSWWTSNADTRMYFQNDDNSYGAFSDVMTYVFNRNSNADKPVYQVTVPAFPNGSGLTAWTKLLGTSL